MAKPIIPLQERKDEFQAQLHKAQYPHSCQCILLLLICTHPLSFLVTQEIIKIADHENNILDLLPFLDIVLKLNIYISKYHRIVADNKYFSTVMHTSEVLLILLCIYTPKDFLTIKVCIG